MLVALIAVTLGACGDDDDAPSGRSGGGTKITGTASLSAAGKRTFDHGTARISGEAVFDGDGEGGQIKSRQTITGAVDLDARRATFTTRTAIEGGTRKEMEAAERLGGEARAIVDGRDIYFKSALFGNRRRGAPWAKSDDDEDAFDPEKQLGAVVKHVVGIRPAGEEDVRGTPTTRHEATLDVEAWERSLPEAEREETLSDYEGLVMTAGKRTVPVQIWVDREGLIRRVVQTYTTGDGGTVRRRESFELFAFGEPVEVELPDPGDVRDAEKLLRKQVKPTLEPE